MATLVVGREGPHLYGEAGLGGQAKLLLKVHQPGSRVVHYILMPHADALLPRLQAQGAAIGTCGGQARGHIMLGLFVTAANHAVERPWWLTLLQGPSSCLQATLLYAFCSSQWH